MKNNNLWVGFIAGFALSRMRRKDKEESQRHLELLEAMRSAGSVTKDHQLSK